MQIILKLIFKSFYMLITFLLGAIINSFNSQPINQNTQYVPGITWTKIMQHNARQPDGNPCTGSLGAIFRYFGVEQVFCLFVFSFGGGHLLPIAFLFSFKLYKSQKQIAFWLKSQRHSTGLSFMGQDSSVWSNIDKTLLFHMHFYIISLHTSINY